MCLIRARASEIANYTNADTRKQNIHTMQGEEKEQASLVDALPYFDALPDRYRGSREVLSAFANLFCGSVRAQVFRELNVELCSSQRTPDQFVAHLPPVPQLTFEGSVFLATEFNRIRVGKPPVKFSSRRTRPAMPEKADDVEGWDALLATSKAEHGYLTTRLLHLQLLKKYGKDAWMSFNDLAAYNKDFIERLQEESKIEVNEVNMARKREHSAAGAKLARLEMRYATLLTQGAAVEDAIAALKKQKTVG